MIEGHSPQASIDVTPSPRILEIIAEVDLQIHQCIAELIDNSFDELQKAESEGSTAESRVDIVLPNHTSAGRDSRIIVGDSGRGMSLSQLETAMQAGSSGNQRFGTLGLFGMGFNVATARLGYVTEVKTGRLGDDFWIVATQDINQMQRERTYKVPVRRESKSPSEHGTIVTVTSLREDTVDRLRNSRELARVRGQLGRIYSYILRDPEKLSFSASDVVGGLGIPLFLNGNPVTPLLPCVWDPSRTVDYKGQAIAAVTEIDFPLTSAYACMNCGYWNSTQPDACPECESADVHERQRRIWGWVGIQRYNDASDFGLAFIRQGRAIAYQDKGLFAWTAEDGEAEVEYPVEVGGGRIVGEIHLDHASVNYRKTDFDRTSRAWTTMVEKVRGNGPMRPNRAKEVGYSENSTALGRLFSAYRRNDPGLRSLVPGNGKNALHELARAWGKKFHANASGYETDEEWYAAAKRHDEIKLGVATTTETAEGDADADWLEQEGLAHLLGEPSTVDQANAPTGKGVGPTDVQAPETIEERFARYRAAARPLPGLDGTVRLGGTSFTLHAYETHGVDLVREDRAGESFTLRIAGGEVHLFVSESHRLIKEYGWDPVDVALMSAAPVLRDAFRDQGFSDQIVVDVLDQFPDKKLFASNIRARAENLLEDIRDLLEGSLHGRPAEAWTALTERSRSAAEELASRTAPAITWTTATADGSFLRYVTASGVEDLVRKLPEHVLDGNVFNTTYSAWGGEARAEVVDRLSGLIGDLRRVSTVTNSTSSRELSRYLLGVDLLAAELVVK